MLLLIINNTFFRISSSSLLEKLSNHRRSASRWNFRWLSRWPRLGLLVLGLGEGTDVLCVQS
jgi:hypothetical protein